MANNAVVGILRTLFTADAGQYLSVFGKTTEAVKKQTKAEEELGKQTVKLTPQAERMAKAFGGDRLTYTANNLVAAIQKVGGATKLTATEQARANSTLSAAIAKYAVLGKEAPAAMLAAERATRGASSATSILASTFGTLTASFSTALIVNRLVGGLISLGNEAIATAGTLVDMSAKTGLSTVTLQQMEHVAGQTSSTLEDFSSAAFKLGVNVAQGTTATRKAFDDLSKSSDALGMSFDQFQTLRPDDQFKRVTAALNDVQDEQERNRIGVLLMGKTYAQIAAAVAQNYNEMASAAKVSTDAQIHALDDAADAWTKFVHDTGIGIQQNLGNIILWTSALKQAIDELGIFASTSSVVARAQFILNEGLLKARTQDIELRKQSVAANIDYIQSLRDAQNELKGLTAADREQLAAGLKVGEETDVLAQRFHIGELAIKLFSGETKEVAKNSKDAAQAIKEFHDEVQALSTDVFGITDKLEASFDKITDTETWEELGKEIDSVQGQIERLEDQIVPFASELDQLRTRELLAMNAPGTGIVRAAQQGGETIGGEMKKGIGRAFEDVPHFLISSVLHSGTFLNGLKAIGIAMADAIAEPLIKAFAMKIAGARLLSAVGGGALGLGAAAGGSFVASEVAGTAAATTAAAGGGAAAAGGGFGGALGGLLTNPWTAVAAGAAVGVGLLIRHLRGGPKANDIRDKDLAQFGPDDLGHRDVNNPPGFYGLSRFLAKFGRHDLFDSFVHAGSEKDVRRAWQPIVELAAMHGRMLKSFDMGGFVPPGVVQPALLHGGLMGEAIVPLSGQQAMSGPPTVHNHYWQAIDGPSVRKFVNSDEFTREMGLAMEFNKGFMTTRLTRGQRGMR